LRVPADEFEQVMPGDIQSTLDRLEEIRKECGVIHAKLYGSMNGAMPMEMGAEPPYQVRMALHDKLDALYMEECELQDWLGNLRWVMPTDASHDPAEDNTQPSAWAGA
jgi:hypothetical protein